MNLMGVIGLQIKGFTIQNFEAVAFTQVTFNIKRLDVETCLANIFHLQKKFLELMTTMNTVPLECFYSNRYLTITQLDLKNFKAINYKFLTYSICQLQRFHCTNIRKIYL